MKHLFYLMVGCCILLSSCAPEPIEEKLVSNQVNRDIPQGTRSLAEAISIAEDFFSQTSNKTRSYPRVIKSVEGISPTQTRSGEEAPALYLINYADNSGFALIGANKEAYDIYAISDEGNLSHEDIQDPFLEMFLAHAQMDASTDDAVVPVIPPIKPDSIKTETVYVNLPPEGPLLSKKSSLWGQEKEFEYNKTSPGCVPVATLLILNYFNWPNKISGFDVDWTSLEDENAKVAKLLHDLGKDYFRIDYINNPGKVMPWNIAPAFNMLELDYDTNYFNTEMNLSDIRNIIHYGYIYEGIPKQPVILMGYNPTNGNGHAFVVDGYVDRMKYVYINGHKYSGPLEADPLFHIVWGWNGIVNGYFNYDILNKVFMSKVILENDGRDDKRDVSTSEYYTNLKMYSGLKPRNN